MSNLNFFNGVFDVFYGFEWHFSITEQKYIFTLICSKFWKKKFLNCCQHYKLICSVLSIWMYTQKTSTAVFKQSHKQFLIILKFNMWHHGNLKFVISHELGIGNRDFHFSLVCGYSTPPLFTSNSVNVYGYQVHHLSSPGHQCYILYGWQSHETDVNHILLNKLV